MGDEPADRQASDEANPTGTQVQDQSGSRAWPEGTEQVGEGSPEPRPSSLWDRFLQLMGVVGSDKRGGPGDLARVPLPRGTSVDAGGAGSRGVARTAEGLRERVAGVVRGEGSERILLVGSVRRS